MNMDPIKVAPFSAQMEAIGPALKTASALILRSWKPLLILLLVQSLIQAVIVYLQMTGAITIPDIPIVSPRLLIAAVFSAAAMHLMLWRSTPDLEEALGVSLRAWPILIIVILVTHLAIKLGFSFLLIPGVAAYFLLKLAPVFVLAERPGIFGSLWSSVRAVLPMPVTLIGMIVMAASVGILCFMFTLIPAMIGMAILEAVFSGLDPDALSESVVVGLAAGWATLIDAAVATAFYLHMRTGGERLAN